ncbi:hypothetical protein [Vibrio gangliei]|uniref:hypothetical protein n=1 Tax=Vibrio gangliei TaxID=2077090 RepID=UPI000D021C54|nr:hypothetical protein [Vibrio gangliei]
MTVNVVSTDSSIDELHLLQDDPNLARAIVTRFALVFTLFLVIFTALTIAVYQEYTANLEQKLLAQEEAFVTSSSNVLQKEMHTLC